MKRRLAALLLFMALAFAPDARAAAISIVAAENFYGDVARQIAGPSVRVVSILNNPDQDPHLFEASPSTARQISDAGIVIYNGVDYDPWVGKLLAVSKRPARKVIVVADLIGKKAGENPHIWYEPRTIPALAEAILAALVSADPDNRAGYESRHRRFRESLRPSEERIAGLRERFAGIPVAATEPVFGYMAEALGLSMRHARFQMAVMNETEPSAADIAAFERDLRAQAVEALFHNSQTSDDLVERLIDVARESKVPVVGITEMLPPYLSYQDWIMGTLAAVERALAGATR